MRVQERYVAIARLQSEIAATDLAYARDLVNYQNERFLNRDFWDALAGVARRSLHRYLDLAGQTASFAERALAYQIATPLRVIRLGYFDPRMRDVGGADRLGVDLAEIEAIELGAARPHGAHHPHLLARARTCRWPSGSSRDGSLHLRPHRRGPPHRPPRDIRAPDPQRRPVRVRPRDGRAHLGHPDQQRLLAAAHETRRRSVPLVRFADAYPISEHRVGGAFRRATRRAAAALRGFGLHHNVVAQASEEGQCRDAGPGHGRPPHVRVAGGVRRAAGRRPRPRPFRGSRSMFASALAVDPKGLGTLRKPAPATAKLSFDLPSLAVPRDCTISNIALVLPGVEGGNISAKLRVGDDAPTSFPIIDGIAMSNAGVLGNGNPAIPQPLNAALGGSPRREVSVGSSRRATTQGRLAAARDVLLWVEFDVP